MTLSYLSHKGDPSKAPLSMMRFSLWTSPADTKEPGWQTQALLVIQKPSGLCCVLAGSSFSLKSQGMDVASWDCLSTAQQNLILRLFLLAPNHQRLFIKVSGQFPRRLFQLEGKSAVRRHAVASVQGSQRGMWWGSCMKAQGASGLFRRDNQGT